MAMPAEAGRASLTGQIALTSEAATVDVNGATGNFEGLALAAKLSFDRFALDLVLPAYRISMDYGTPHHGLGDLMLTGGYALPLGDASLTADAMVSLPTGDDSLSMGMGHAMLMPSLGLAWRRDRLNVHGSLGVGSAVGDAGHQHGAVPSPLVAPTNHNELDETLDASLGLSRTVRLEAALLAAQPIVHPGQARLVSSLALRRALGACELGAALAVPWMGSSVRFQTSIDVAWSFQ